MQIVILAGGEGTRLKSLTKSIPKPMVTIGNVPFLEILIKHLASQGFKDFHIILGYLPDYIPSYFIKNNNFELNISYSGDSKNLYRGTGGALKNAEPDLEDNFILLFGDTFLALDYQRLAKSHLNSPGKAVLVVYNNEINADVINNIALDENNMVTKYNKNSVESLEYVDAGSISCSKDVLRYIKKDQNISLEEMVYPKLIKHKELYALKAKEKFYDIGTPERLKAFELYYYDNLKNTPKN